MFGSILASKELIEITVRIRVKLGNNGSVVWQDSFNIRKQEKHLRLKKSLTLDLSCFCRSSFGYY